MKATDGKTDLFGSIYLPHDFDPARKYPVIDLQYMGNFVHYAPRTIRPARVVRNIDLTSIMAPA